MTDDDKRLSRYRPAPVAQTVERLLRGAPGARRARGFAALRRDWADVAGPEFKDLAWPERLEPARAGRPGALAVRAAPGAALLLQHDGPRLVERVNAYLGAEAIGRIRIARGAPPPPKPSRRLPAPPLPADDPAARDLARRADGLGSDRLAAALTRLGRAVGGAAAAAKPTGRAPPRSRS